MLELAATAWRTFDVSLDRDEMGHCFKSLVQKGSFFKYVDERRWVGGK